MSELRPCGFPACVALARNDVFCSSHAAMMRAATQPDSRRDRAETRASLLQSILKIVGDGRREFRDIQVAPLPIPGFLDYQFHSPDAILVVERGTWPRGRRLRCLPPTGAREAATPALSLPAVRRAREALGYARLRCANRALGRRRNGARHLSDRTAASVQDEAVSSHAAMPTMSSAARLR